MQYPYNGQRQIKLTQPIALFTLSGAGTNGDQTAEARVLLPDSRLQTKVSVYFSPDPSSGIVFPFDITNLNATILMQEEDEAYGGPFSGYVPLTTIVATPGPPPAPLPLPQAPGLIGYSRELVTAADAVHIFLKINQGAETGIVGQWMLQCRYQPYGQRLPDLDWDETKPLCNATSLTGGQVF